MYFESLETFKRVLKKNGYVFFKCQDMTDNKFYCTHNDIINIAKDLGLELKDNSYKKLITQKLQKDSVQQNCVAKVHSYWLVLKLKSGVK